MRGYVFDTDGNYAIRNPDPDGDGLFKEVDPDNDNGELNRPAAKTLTTTVSTNPRWARPTTSIRTRNEIARHPAATWSPSLPGAFQMGCDPAHNGGYGCAGDELPLHTVYLDDYLIDRTEVTNGQYAACVAAGPCTLPAFSSSDTRPLYYGNPTYADYPVIWVEWSKPTRIVSG